MIKIDRHYGDICDVGDWPTDFGIPSEGQEIFVADEHLPSKWTITDTTVHLQENDRWVAVDVRPANTLTALKWYVKVKIYRAGRKLFSPRGLWWRNRWVEPYASWPDHDPNETRTVMEIVDDRKSAA